MPEELNLPRVAVLNGDTRTQKYLLDRDFLPRPDLPTSMAQEFLMSTTYHKKEELPFRVATIMKNASGLQLTYRGTTLLPNIN